MFFKLNINRSAKTRLYMRPFNQRSSYHPVSKEYKSNNFPSFLWLCHHKMIGKHKHLDARLEIPRTFWNAFYLCSDMSLSSSNTCALQTMLIRPSLHILPVYISFCLINSGRYHSHQCNNDSYWRLFYNYYSLSAVTQIK